MTNHDNPSGKAGLAGTDVVDFADPAIRRDPFPALAQLLDRQPLHWNAGLRAWVLVRYGDLDWAFKNPAFSADRIRPFLAGARRLDAATRQRLGAVLPLWLVFNDGTAQARLRALIAPSLAPRAIDGLAPRIAAETDRLIAGIASRGGGDLIADFATALPLAVSAALLGLPTGDLPQIKGWCDDLAGLVMMARDDPDRHRRAADGLAQLSDYFSALIARRQARPQAGLIDRLIAAAVDDDALSGPELLAAATMLALAGHETAGRFLGNAARALLTDATARRAFVAGADDPAFRRGALHELLRRDGPSFAQGRVMATAVDRHGQTVPAGDRVFLLIAAANRDPRIFRAPDRLDFHRRTAIKHLGFGAGPHFCPGAALARLEAEIALPRLLIALPGLRGDGPLDDWGDSFVLRGLRRLPVRLR